MQQNQSQKAVEFQNLHTRRRSFVMPNPWDAGSARMLAKMGFRALATSSGAAAGVLGRQDGSISREAALAHAGVIVDATDLPVSADLEKGFGDDPRTVAETIRMAAEIGLVGASIEDFTGRKDKPFYDLGLAVERIAAAAQMIKTFPLPFTLTARAENFLRGNPDLKATIARLQDYERAGADVLFAPGLPDLAAVQAVCAAVTKPVNFMVGIRGKSFSVADLEAAGVQRISLAGSLYRAAMTGLFEAAREIKDSGTFSYLDRSLTSAEINDYVS